MCEGCSAWTGLQSPGSAAAETKREFDYDRTVALSDGVFAIALTLLVLSIEVTEPGPEEARPACGSWWWSSGGR